MSGLLVLAGVAAGIAAAVGAPTGLVPHRKGAPRAAVADQVGPWPMSVRLGVSLGLGGGLIGLLGSGAWPVAFGVALGVWRWSRRMSGPREGPDPLAVRRDLPHLVGLMVGPLRAGASPTEALRIVTTALPGPGARLLAEPLAALAVGVDQGQVWHSMAADPLLGDLGRALIRAHRTGASVVESVHRLSDELRQQERIAVENSARTIGVRAAVPLGVCLLPAFLVLGVVPLVAGLVGSVLV